MVFANFSTKCTYIVKSGHEYWDNANTPLIYKPAFFRHSLAILSNQPYNTSDKHYEFQMATLGQNSYQQVAPSSRYRAKMKMFTLFGTLLKCLLNQVAKYNLYYK